ncbi:hypothetical protein MTO96_034535, partial [Rhipicephalus appendiculatus]
ELSRTSKEKLEKMKATVQQSKVSVEELQAKTKEMSKVIAAMERKKDEETGDKLESLGVRLKDCQLEETKANSDLQFSKGRIKEEHKTRTGLQKKPRRGQGRNCEQGEAGAEVARGARAAGGGE